MTVSAPEKPNTLADLTLEEKRLAYRHFKKHPMKFIDSIIMPRLGITLEAGQRDVLNDIFEHKKVLVPTHFAFGKSFISALAVLAIMNLNLEECEAHTLAPTFRQVQDILWKEMRDIHTKCNKEEIILDGKMTLTRYDIDTKTFAVGISPRRAAKGAVTPQYLSGSHAAVVIVVGDEAGALDDQIFDQVENITNTPGDVYIIYIGNPLIKTSRFGKMCLTEEGEGYVVNHKKAYEAPNMATNGLTSIEALRTEGAKIRDLPRDERKEYYDNKHYKIVNKHLLSPGWVMKCYIKWGESQLFLSKVIGEWTDRTENTLIPFERAIEIMHGSYIDEEGKRCWTSEERGYAKWNGIKNLYVGVDCAGQGTDRRVIHVLEGNREFHKKVFTKTYEKSNLDYKGTKLKEDGKYVADYIHSMIIVPNPERLIFIVIDVTGGFGDSVYEHLINKNLNSKFVKIIRLNFAQKASTEEKEEIYHDIIAEMAIELSEDIMSNEGLLLEPDDDLQNQLTDRLKTQDGKKRHMLEAKDEYKARHSGESPDEFDALMLANKARHLKDGSDRLKSAIVQANKTMTERNKPASKNIPPPPSDDDERDEY
jgi:hypothetical protein